GAVAHWHRRATIPAQRWQPARHAGAVGAAAIASVYTLGALLDSPLVRPYDQWLRAGQVVQRQLAGTAACTQGLADGTSVTFWDLPRDVHPGDDAAEMLGITLFEPFTLT